MTERTTGEPCTRTDQTVRWVVWHAGELTGVTVPLLLAEAFTAWFALISVTVAIGWAVHEIQLARRRRAVATGAAPAALLTEKSSTTTTSVTTNSGSEASA
jgi:hypothetical protein